MSKDTTNPLPEKKGRMLLYLARNEIASKLGAAGEESPAPEEMLKDEAFDARRGTFVTLTKNNRLRGCIGNLLPENSIREGVRENAVNAAFNDPRFPPVNREELDSLHLEISILTEPAELEYNGADDLLSQLTPGADGVIIRKGGHSSTFLPQVWEQLPDKETFLGHLCLKAGLAADEWKKGDLQVYTYRCQYFRE